MTIFMFGVKSGRLASRRTPSQLWSTGVAASCCGVLCCSRNWWTSQNRWHHESGKWCGYIEATSQDISQEVKSFQMDNNPRHTLKVVAKWPKDNKVKVLEWPSQSPDHNPIENLWAELKRCVWERGPTNRTQVHQLCQEEWDKIHLTYFGKTHVKQFKGNATKY